MSVPGLLPSQDNRAGITIPYGSPTLTPVYALGDAEADIAWALKEITGYCPVYEEYQRYYGGEHRLAFSTEGYRQQFANMVKRLNANLAPAVISAFTDKLELTGFAEHTGSTAADSGGQVAAEAGEADEAWALWEDADLTLLADEVHDETEINGDGYVIVWPDEDGRAAFYANDATQCAARYNVERKDRIDLGAKLWREGAYWRLTLYYADRLEKYRTRTPDKSGTPPSKPAAFMPYKPDGDAEWPLYHEYGVVPMFHFPAGGKVGGRGISELRDVIPIQDALNKALADTIVAEEFGAYVQRWATGVEKKTKFDPETNAEVEVEADAEVGIRRILTASSEAARFGQFTPTDLGKFIELINAHFAIVGKLKGIPPHYWFQITGDFPSGESQRTAEGRLVKRVEKLQRRFGAIWARIVALGLLINGIGDGTPAYKAQWKSAEPRGQQEQAANFKTATDAGMPMETAAKMFLGMPQEEIDTMLEKKDAEDQAAAATAQAAFSRAMDRGNVVPPAKGGRGGTLPGKSTP